MGGEHVEHSPGRADPGPPSAGTITPPWRTPAGIACGCRARALAGALAGYGPGFVLARDMDAVGLGLLADGDGQREDARGVISRDVLGVEGFTEEDVAAERARRALGD